MSVLTTFQLPDQPAAGAVEYVPLGGDGFRAPKFAYTVLSAQSASDATGGTNTLELQMDPRYCSLVSFVTGQMIQVTQADSEFLYFLLGDHVPIQLIQGDMTHTVLSSSELGQTWRPGPFILPGGTSAVPPAIHVRFPNVAVGDIVRLHAMVFCFDISVRETTPMGPLLWARGDS